MEKAKIKYFIDLGMGISFLVVFVTGIFKFPGYPRQLFSAVYNVIPGRLMAQLHDWSGIIMGMFVLVHLILNWDWIKTITKSILKGKVNK